MTMNRDMTLRLEAMSRIELSESERAGAQAELQNVLTQLEPLTTLDTDDVPPMYHAMPLVNVTREDVAEPSMEPEILLANAAREKNDCFMVHRTVD